MQNTTPISRIMTRKPATVGPNDTLETVRNIFERNGFHHIPVVEQGKLTGIVSYTDYLRVISEVYGEALQPRNGEEALKTVSVKEVMTAFVVCLAPSDTVENALSVFKTNQFHAIPVVEGEGRLVGILSTHDLIKMLERELAPEIDYATA